MASLVGKTSASSTDAKTFQHISGLILSTFKKKSKKDILLANYKKLNEEAYKLSHHDRKASDKKLKEANDILEQINALEEISKNWLVSQFILII